MGRTRARWLTGRHLGAYPSAYEPDNIPLQLFLHLFKFPALFPETAPPQTLRFLEGFCSVLLFEVLEMDPGFTELD